MPRIHSIALVALLLALLSACGSAPTDDSTGGQPSASAPPDQASAAPLPAESASPAANASGKDDAPSSDLIAALTRSGGLVGRTQTLLVRQDGTVALLNGEQGSPPFKTGKASAEQLQSLRTLLASPEWQQLDASYGQQVPDGFAYTVTGGGVQVQTYDGTQNPAALENVLSKLNELWQVAQSGS